MIKSTHRPARMASLAAVLCALTICGISAAIALNPAPARQQAPAQNVAASAMPEATRKAPRVISIMGHENCAFVEVRRGTDGKSEQVRCLRKL